MSPTVFAERARVETVLCVLAEELLVDERLVDDVGELAALVTKENGPFDLGDVADLHEHVARLRAELEWLKGLRCAVLEAETAESAS